MSKMFTYNGKRMITWNLFTGCNFGCCYCWARDLSNTRLKHTAKYKNGFVPTAWPKDFGKHFAPGDFVFVSSMGDIAFAPSEVLDEIAKTASECPQTKFLLCTKSPAVYTRREFPANVYLGATIETNRAYSDSISRAPQTLQRYNAMKGLEGNPKFVSVEPVMDFDLDIFASWIADISPQMVQIGADNHNQNLPEPTRAKIERLIEAMRESGATVIRKKGLERI